METVYRIGGFGLKINLNNEEAVIIGFEGSDSSLTVPDTISISGKQYLVTGIDKKAFLGCKGLRKVILPATVNNIGDWAFSQCIHLNSFEAYKSVNLGRGVFEGCTRISYLDFKDSNADAPFLLACVVNKLPAQYLLLPIDIGTKEWFAGFDSALSQYLMESDYSDSNSNAICGEEDISYDDIASVDGELLGENAKFIQEITKKKSYLCLIRLLHSTYLDANHKCAFEEFVKSHSITSKNDAAWQTIRDDFSDDKELFSLYLDIVNPNSSEIDMMLEDLGGNHPQAKASLLNYRKSDTKLDNFFDDMLL